ncbi:type II restriction endonuclease subunit M [Paraburkholderia sp. DD10]|uniref:type II restriction endonuclease subunit M n=1 Tax=Paraburkholderia sp. DD10 TaxID=3409691 RepID=UPI003BA10EB9
MTVFFRVLDASVDQKAEALLQAVSAYRGAAGRDSEGAIYTPDPEAFVSVPGSPFAYWVSDQIRGAFAKHSPLQHGNREAVFGGSTKDDRRYLRLWCEVGDDNVTQSRADSSRKRWSLFAKGGAHSPHYADIHLVVNWYQDGAELKSDIAEYRGSRGWGYHWTAALNGHDHYFRPGLTWPRRTNGLSFRALPRGCIFADKGPAVFEGSDSSERLLALSAIVNSRAFGYLVSVQLARTELAQSYEVGLIQQTPVPDLSERDAATLAQLAGRAWSLKRALDSTNETSHAFVLPPLLNEKVSGLDRATVEQKLESIQKDVDDAAIGLYGIGADDRVLVEASSKRAASGAEATYESSEENDVDVIEDDPPGGATSDALLSWAVGVAFGRFDPRLATGERPIPTESEPFDPLPSRSPGMYPAGEGLADRPDVLVDDEGHAEDLAARVHAVADRVHVDVPDNLRARLASELFPLHIKMYSKSRRKAPIYWQLATPSASYSVWIYIHAFSNDTLFRVQNDYAAPKLAHEERRLASIISELRDKATATERKGLAIQQCFVDELRAFLKEVKRVAPLWRPNLDDGVIVNFAPLWRLVPHNKSWQKELKSTWDALCEGKYDWAHLAMYLWPERVVPECAKDRSLAIAHSLEDVFWVAGTDGKWTVRTTPTRSVEELVRERTSLAVKSALKSLLEAHAATGNAGRGRGDRSKTAAEGGNT